MKNRILLVLSCALITSCYTSNKAVKQSVKAYVEYPKEVAELHSKWYPVSTSRTIEKEYIQGKDSLIYDTVIVDCEDVVHEVEKIVKVPVIKHSTRVDTLRTSIIDSIENTAKLENFQRVIDRINQDLVNERLAHTKTKSELKEAKKQRNIFGVSFLGLIALIFAYKYLKNKFKFIKF